ncbi:RTA1 like protein-domain-containing protein [Exophiala viscosa]|uniref:RTA1 like protein-domain-containing protein n=1 Tax=Exophiala viscosa TaxID=2486360 RepID=UPI0021A23E6C|nr:RTA1 like protein-domain-containing protein [Exophiala viscosa]
MIVDAAVAGAVNLVARSYSATGLPGGKTAAEYAVEGRYSYVPSFAAAIIFCVLFGLAFVINVYQLFRHRAWFWWVMNFAVLMELVGYIARARSIKELDGKSIFIVQTVMILVAPAVMAASCYTAFGRVTLWVVPQEYQTVKHLWVPPRRITPVFVGCDVFSFFIQVVGGSMVAAANSISKANTGKNVVLVGLALQLVTFGFFVFAAGRLNYKLKTELRNASLPRDRNWEMFLNVINIANLLILVRTLLRLVEFAMGTSNYLTNHEWFFYVFDATLMFLVAAIFLVFHPGYYLPYLGIRRREQKFSKNADKGPLSRLAHGRKTMNEAV